MNNRVTVNLEHNKKIYTIHYMPSYYDNTYQGHRYEKIVEADGKIESSMIVDRPMLTSMCIVGTGIEMKNEGFISTNIMCSMVHVIELDILFPYWLIKIME